MKNLPGSRKRNGKKRYHQGFYTVKNTLKYTGDLSNVRYLSLWELKFFIYCDNNPAIQKWSSEFIKIPYQTEKGKWHNYFPDIYIEKVNSRDPDILDRWVLEIKPYNEVHPKFVHPNGTIIPPEHYLKKRTSTALESYEYQLKTYQKNLYKWTKAKSWCKMNGLIFMIVDEKYMKKMGIL